MVSSVSEARTYTRVVYSIVIIVGLLTAGAIAFHSLENLSWLDSFYIATITLTTIGYGDITPTKDATKVFVMFYALIGVATVLLLMTNISRYYIERRERQFESRFTELRKARLHKRLPLPPTMRRR